MVGRAIRQVFSIFIDTKGRTASRDFEKNANHESKRNLNQK
jgi:hypothetical protein